MFAAVAIGGIGSATVILSLASLPATEQSSHVIKLVAIVDSPRPELQPTLASATPDIVERHFRPVGALELKFEN